MITLITGGTGDGKTALAVSMMLREYAGRPLFVMGIPDLKLDHQPTPPVDEWTEYRKAPEDPELELAYFTFPPNSVVFLDEAQRVFRPRPTGSKVPPEVQAFETHRHLGIDFVLITQAPQLLDVNIRRLVKRHLHIHATPIGKRLLEWPSLGDPDDKSNREIAAKRKYKPPKEAFGLYKSAEAHTTVKYRRPWYVYLFGFAILAFVIASYMGYSAIKAKLNPQSPNIESLTVQSSSHRQPEPSATKTVLEYHREGVPRVDGLHHTAPKYDEVTKVTDAPWPSGCMIIHAYREKSERCRCSDQQGNDYATSDSMCRQIVAHGLFKDWGQAARDDGTPEAARKRGAVSDSEQSAANPDSRGAPAV